MFFILWLSSACITHSLTMSLSLSLLHFLSPSLYPCPCLSFRYVIGSCIKHIPLAGRTITQYIQQLMRERKEPIPAEVSAYLLYCHQNHSSFFLFLSLRCISFFNIVTVIHRKNLSSPNQCVISPYNASIVRFLVRLC